MSAPLRLCAWVTEDRVATQNADGSATGWELDDAKRLHAELGEAIGALEKMASAAESEFRKFITRTTPTPPTTADA